MSTPTDITLPVAVPAAGHTDAQGQPIDRDYLAKMLGLTWANGGQVPVRPNGIIAVGEALVVVSLLRELTAMLPVGDALAEVATAAAGSLERRANARGAVT